MKWSNKIIDAIPKQYRAVAFGVVFGLFGVTLGLGVRAATSTASVEVESGSLSGGATSQTDSSASGGGYAKFGTCNPTVDALLVPSCGVWLGGFANSHPGVTTFKDRILDHETRIGRQVSFVHTYHQPTDTGLSSDDIYFVNRANTYLLANWKPVTLWADADGSNSTVNARIDSFANSIKSVAPKKIMLVIYHEPENDVSGGASGCGSITYVGSAGTPADYVAMWANVRARFDALGVNNVVWAMNYMSNSSWSCLKDDLWPGNNLVDWVLYNRYPGDSDTWASSMGEMYTWLTDNSDATHDYLSKNWGVGEWGSWAHTQANAYQLYDDGATAIANGMYPRLKLYTVFDSGSSFVDYDDDTGLPDAVELQHYSDFANSAGFIK